MEIAQIEAELDLKQQEADYVQLKLDEWLMEHPEPEKAHEEKPDMPPSAFLPLVTHGFIVLEVVHTKSIRLHISVPKHSSVYIEIVNQDIGNLIDQLMAIEEQQESIDEWVSSNGTVAARHNNWKSLRGQALSEAKRDFVKSQEIAT